MVAPAFPANSIPPETLRRDLHDGGRSTVRRRLEIDMWMAG
jgi:hypothetical protein